MPFLTDAATYTETFEDPDGGSETLEVELRVLNAGDKAELEDLIAMDVDEEERLTAGMKLGTMKLLTVSRAIVRWRILDAADAGPMPAPSPDVIRRLHPATFEAIFDRIRFGGASPLAASSASAGESSS